MAILRPPDPLSGLDDLRAEQALARRRLERHLAGSPALIDPVPDWPYGPYHRLVTPEEQARLLSCGERFRHLFWSVRSVPVNPWRSFIDEHEDAADVAVQEVECPCILPAGHPVEQPCRCGHGVARPNLARRPWRWGVR